jgi:hypothetical protein
MEQAVAFMAGVNFLVLGLSYFFNSGDWIAWSLTIGMINLLIGGFILGFHWKWEGIALVLSVAGVLATINGTIYMLFPNFLPDVLEWQEPHCRTILLVASIILIAVGLTSLCEWWQLAGYAVPK